VPCSAVGCPCSRLPSRHISQHLLQEQRSRIRSSPASCSGLSDLEGRRYGVEDTIEGLVNSAGYTSSKPGVSSRVQTSCARQDVEDGVKRATALPALLIHENCHRVSKTLPTRLITCNFCGLSTAEVRTPSLCHQPTPCKTIRVRRSQPEQRRHHNGRRK